MNRPTGIIRLTIQGSVMTSNMITPTCRINGHPVPTRYGAQDLTVWAGPNHLDLEAQWMRTYGQAAIDVDVAPGQVVEVFYAAPLHQFARGNIGLVKQSRPGLMPCSAASGLRGRPGVADRRGDPRELTRVQWSLWPPGPMAGRPAWPLDSAGPVDNASAVSARHQAGVREARPTSSGMPRGLPPSGPALGAGRGGCAAATSGIRCEVS
jgi:hypothetical protein